MGMDSIELVMEVEDEFAISLPDELLERCMVVGQLCDAVVQTVRQNPTHPLNANADLQSYVFEHVRIITSKVCGVHTGDIQRETRFNDDLHLD